MAVHLSFQVQLLLVFFVIDKEEKMRKGFLIAGQNWWTPFSCNIPVTN